MITDLESLWHSHNRRIYGYIFTRVRDHHIAEDLLSCVYLRALVAIRNGNGAVSNETSWLFTIARSVLIDHWRAMQHMTFVDFDSLEDEPDTQASPYTQAEAGVIREHIRRSMVRLGESYPQLLESRRQGYSFAEIGDLLGITTAAAKQRGTRAYMALREPVAGLVAFVEVT